MEYGSKDEWEDLLTRVTSALTRVGVPYFITGSVAQWQWGEYRATADVDIVALMTSAQLDALLVALPEPEYCTSIDGARQAVRHGGMFNIIDLKTVIKVDIVIPKPGPWTTLQFRRATNHTYGASKVHANTVSAEDLILNKLLFYKDGGSVKHLRDIASIIRIQSGNLDLAYLNEWSENLQVADLWAKIQEFERKAP